MALPHSPDLHPSRIPECISQRNFSTAECHMRRYVNQRTQRHTLKKRQNLWARQHHNDAALRSDKLILMSAYQM
jgi:hypothetical protein